VKPSLLYGTLRPHQYGAILKMEPVMRRAIMISLCIVLSSLSCAQGAEPAVREPYGIGLEGFAYPYPVHLLPLVNDGEQVRMAYMDVAAAQPNGRTVVLLHGRNFPSR
jgi:hypothetical protein